MSDEELELESWLVRIAGVSDLSIDSLKGIVGSDSIPEDHGLDKREWLLFSLYFIISRRLFSDKELSSRDVMLIKSFQDLVTGIVKTLEIREDIFWLWKNI